MVFERFWSGIDVRAVLTSLLAASIVTACASSGRSVPEILVNGDDCSYEGQSEFSAGDVTTVLQMRSLGRTAVAVLALDGDLTYAEVVDYYARQADPVPAIPEFTDQVVYFEIEQEGGEGIGDRRTTDMSSGTYAVVCIDFQRSDGPKAIAIAEVVVIDR